MNINETNQSINRWGPAAGGEALRIRQSPKGPVRIFEELRSILTNLYEILSPAPRPLLPDQISLTLFRIFRQHFQFLSDQKLSLVLEACFGDKGDPKGV